MAASEYHHGDMDIHDQEATWHGFLTGGTWGALIIGLALGHAILAVAIGLHWAVSLGLMAIAGFAAGLFLNLGGRWMATLVILIITALFIQFMIWLFGVLI